MEENKLQPISIVQAASQMAITVGFLCSVSFLCSVRGINSPGIATIGHLAGLLAIYNIYRGILKYRFLVQDIPFFKCFVLALLTCIFAGLLTNVVQYLYFQFFDKGFFLTTLATIMEKPEYKMMMKEIFADVPQSQLDNALQQVNIQTLMAQIIIFNIMLSVPVSLITAAIASIPKVKKNTTNESEQNTENQ